MYRDDLDLGVIWPKYFDSSIKELCSFQAVPNECIASARRRAENHKNATEKGPLTD